MLTCKFTLQSQGRPEYMSSGLIVWGLIPSRMSKKPECEANQQSLSSDQFQNEWNFMLSLSL